MSDSSPDLPDLPDLPEVEALDPEPVAVAIETARALFRTGELMEALRWLRRAAERAEESGDDVRALNLARSAADLSTALQSVLPPRTSVAAPAAPPPAAPPPRASVPPPAPPPPVPPPLVPPPAPSPASMPTSPASMPTSPASMPTSPPTPRRLDEAVALSPYDDFSDKTQVDAAAPVQRDALQSGVQITDMPAASQAAPRSITMPSPPSSEPTVANAQFTPVVEVKRPAVRSAVRVAVTRDPESADTWLVRPLSEGSEVPPGCEEALLVALDPKSRFLQ